MKFGVNAIAACGINAAVVPDEFNIGKPETISDAMCNMYLDIENLVADMKEDEVFNATLKDKIINLYKGFYTVDQTYAHLSSLQTAFFDYVTNANKYFATLCTIFKHQNLDQLEIKINNFKFKDLLRGNNWGTLDYDAISDFFENYATAKKSVTSYKGLFEDLRPSNAVWAQYFLVGLSSIQMNEKVADRLWDLYSKVGVFRPQSRYTGMNRYFNFDYCELSLEDSQDVDKVVEKLSQYVDACETIIAEYPYFSELLTAMGYGSVFAEKSYKDGELVINFRKYDFTRNIHAQRIDFLYDNKDVLYNTFVSALISPFNKNDVNHEANAWQNFILPLTSEDTVLSVMQKQYFSGENNVTEAIPLEVALYPSILDLVFKGNLQLLNIVVYKRETYKDEDNIYQLRWTKLFACPRYLKTMVGQLNLSDPGLDTTDTTVDILNTIREKSTAILDNINDNNLLVSRLVIPSVPSFVYFGWPSDSDTPIAVDADYMFTWQALVTNYICDLDDMIMREDTVEPSIATAALAFMVGVSDYTFTQATLTDKSKSNNNPKKDKNPKKDNKDKGKEKEEK